MCATRPRIAAVLRAGVAVVAIDWIVYAAAGRIARIVGADIDVITIEWVGVLANVVQARLGTVAGISVIAIQVFEAALTDCTRRARALEGAEQGITLLGGLCFCALAVREATGARRWGRARVGLANGPRTLWHVANADAVQRRNR